MQMTQTRIEAKWKHSAIILAKGLQSIIWPNGSQPAVIKIYVYLGISPDICGLDIYKHPHRVSKFIGNMHNAASANLNSDKLGLTKSLTNT